MSALIDWVVDMVQVALGSIPNELRPLDEGVTVAELLRGHEQRVACLLLQARARECRHLRTDVTVSQTLRPEVKQFIGGWLTDRSHTLEEMAKELAQPDAWPPKENLIVEAAPEVEIIQ